MDEATVSAITTPISTAAGKLLPLRQNLAAAETTDYSNFAFLAKISLLAILGIAMIIIGYYLLSKFSNRSNRRTSSKT